MLCTRLAQTSYQKTNAIFRISSVSGKSFKGLVRNVPFLSIFIKFPFCRNLGADVIDIFGALVAAGVAEWSNAPGLSWDVWEPWVKFPPSRTFVI